MNSPEHFRCSPAISWCSPSSTALCSDCRKASAHSALLSLPIDDLSGGVVGVTGEDIVALVILMLCSFKVDSHLGHKTLEVFTVQRSAKSYANLIKQQPGRDMLNS